MTCSTCHNPHPAKRIGRAEEFYSAVCRKCHAATHGAGMRGKSTCLDCHMAKRRPDDVVHAVVTDHNIRRRILGGDVLEPRKETHDVYRGQIVPYYPARDTPEDELYLAVARARYSADLAIGIARLQRAIERRQPARPEFYFELGVACWKDGRREEAVQWYNKALQHGDYRPARQALGEALVATGKLQQAAEVLEPLAEKLPPEADTLFALGELFFQQGKLEPAGQALERALRVDPDLYQAQNLRGVVLGLSGNRTAAGEAFREAILVRPDFDTAHVNLALLLAGDGDYARAEYHLRQAITSNPENVEAHHTLRSGALAQRSLRRGRRGTAGGGAARSQLRRSAC